MYIKYCLYVQLSLCLLNNKKNFIMNLKRLLLKPTGVLCFLIALFSCEDNVTSDIEDVEESVTYDYDVEIMEDGTVFRKETAEEIEARWAEEFAQYSRRGTRVMANSNHSSTPHWVGVLSSVGSCRGYNIQYFMDCQDDQPLKFKDNATDYLGDRRDYQSPGAIVDGAGNVTWSVCIVDANKYKFVHVNFAYAIFDLSPLTFLNGALEIKIHSDDEDKNNANKYLSPQFGFAIDNNPNSYPYQQKMGNTEFRLYYFAKNAKSTEKLPDLGFPYDVFGNQSYVKGSSTQNILRTDSEDSNNQNKVYIWDKNGVVKYYGHECNYYDDNYKYESEYSRERVFWDTGNHIYFAIQKTTINNRYGKEPFY